MEKIILTKENTEDVISKINEFVKKSNRIVIKTANFQIDNEEIKKKDNTIVVITSNISISKSEQGLMLYPTKLDTLSNSVLALQIYYGVTIYIEKGILYIHSSKDKEALYLELDQCSDLSNL